MSGVVDSGRESGHGNIAANDPNRSKAEAEFRSAASPDLMLVNP
jgi:hypothetical protein